MSIPKQILKELNELHLNGLSEKVENFFKPLSERNSNLGRNEVDIYYSFIKSCLQICFTNQTSVEGKKHVQVFLKIAVLCCKGYEKIFHSLDRETFLVVPTMVYHVAHNVQEQEHFEMAICLSELAYKMLAGENNKVPMEAHHIINYFFEYLWNTSCRHIKQSQLGATFQFESILKMRKVSLMFQSLLPDTDQLLVNVRTMVALVTHLHKDEVKNRNISHDSWQIIYSTFAEVLVIIENMFHEVSDKNIIVVQTYSIFIECLLKFCKFEKVNELLKIIKHKRPFGSDFMHIIADLYTSTVHVGQVHTGQCFAACDWTVVQKANINVNKLIDKCSLAELNVILGAYLCFIQTFGVNVPETLKADIVVMHVLLEMCDILETLSTKLIMASTWKIGDVETKKGGVTDEIVKLFTSMMTAFYSQLQFISHILQHNLGEERHLSEIRQKSILLANRFQNVLKENAGTLSKNSVCAQKKNLGYICLEIGSMFNGGCFYEEAASILSIAEKQLHSCEQPNMLRVFVLQTESYQKLEKWTEATNVVVQALVVLPDRFETIVTLWARLKRDAIAKKPIFQSITLKTVSQSSAVSLANVTPRQILLAEYAAWKNCSVRDYIVEYHILCELMDACATDVKMQAEVMIDLATILCTTGMKHKDRSAVDILNEAVVILEKAAGDSKALLALAYYSLYAGMHEDVTEQLQEDIKVEPNDISDDSINCPKTNYTLQSDQSYFLYLVRAIDLWEESLGKRKSHTKFDKSKQKRHSRNTDNVKENCKAEIETEVVFLISLERHVDTLILCGERLVAMKQPQLALRPLLIAQDQLSNLKDAKRVGDWSIQLGRTLIGLGQYEEAESVLAVDSNDDQGNMRKSLLLSELYICMGKREKGLEILRSVPVGNECKKMSQKMCMTSGTAKRLLSMSMCFPGDHIIQSDNQYLLSLASEAVHCHITVFHYLTKKKLLDKNADKWQLLYEILQSLLHFCQLCRFTGLRSDAIGYIQDGVNISQAHGLPRWSCEFLLELFEIHCMVADCEKAVMTAESITNLLNVSNKSSNCLKEEMPSRTKSITESKDENSCVQNSKCSRVKEDFNSEVIVDNKCFGCDILVVTPVVKDVNLEVKMPESRYNDEKIDIDTKNKLMQMSVPECLCMKNQGNDCKDIVTHRLCMKAGIAMSDFLLQFNMRPASERLLSEVQAKFNVISNWAGNQVIKLMEISNGAGNQDIKLNAISYEEGSQNPELMYINLGASCVQAESFLHQRQYSKVHQIWLMFQEMDRAGYLQNVLHSHILMTRLALSDAGTYMLSLSSKMDSVARKEPLKTDNCVSTLGTDMSKLGLSKKKVSFCHESEPLSDFNGSHTTKLEPKLDCFIPKTSKLASTSSSLKKSSSHNSTGNLMNVLNQLMESDDTKQEDFVVFSDESKVTRQVNRKSLKIKSVKSETEPRQSLKKKLEHNPEHSNVVCKLDFANGSSTEQKHLENNENSADDNARKQTEMCVLSTDEFEALKCSSKKVESKLRSANRAVRTFSKAVIVNDAVNAIQNVQVDGSLRVKYDGDVGSKLLNGIEDFVVFSDESKVTRQVNRKSSKIKSVKSETEPRQSLKKKLEHNPEHSNAAFKLDFSNGSSTEQKHLENNENSADDNARKQTEMCVLSTDELGALKCSSKKVESKLRSANRAVRTSSKAVIVNDAVNAIQNVQVDGSLRVKYDGDVGSKLLNGIEDFVVFSDESKVTRQVNRKSSKIKSVKSKTEPRYSLIKKLEHNPEHSNIADEVAALKCTSKKVDLVENESTKGDVFDFALEASPLVSKGTQSGKARKRKGTQNQKVADILKKTTAKNSRKALCLAFENLEESSQENTKNLLNTSYCKNLVESKKISENMNSAQNAAFGIEKMRSGQLSNMKECFGKMNQDELEPLCRIVTATDLETLCQEDIILSLESLYDRLSRYPPSPQHSDVCHMLALHYLDSKPSRAAFLLSDAIAVTFRHQAMLNVGIKARKLLNDGAGRSENTALAMLHNVKPDFMFGVDDHQWHDLLTTIPEDWCIVQLSVVGTGLPQRQMILTRFVKDQDPLILRLPAFNSPQGRRILSEFSAILKQNEQTSKILSKTEWWKTRGKLNLDLQDLIERMEMYWLGIWRCAMLAPEHSTKIKLAVQKSLQETLKQTISLAHIEVLLLGCKVLSSTEIQQCLSQVLVTQCSSADYESIIALLKEYTSDLADHSDSRHTVLILDKIIQHLPWESVAILQDKSVTRMPCFLHLCTQLNYFGGQENSVFVKGVDPHSTYYILNPDSDLPRTEEHFRAWFTNEPDWKGVYGTRPSNDQFTEALTQRDFLIYCGHGNGSKYFNSDKIEKLSGRAAAMLMGCSSGRLLVKGQLEPSGMMISYFLAGCPCMVANLWDVTDKDIDKFTMECLKSWFSAPNGSYLPGHVQKARAVCKLKYLNGSAPVVYGLPIFVKQSNEYKSNLVH